jgi:glycosyltransferase involved in cell wall biosynthesis
MENRSIRLAKRCLVFSASLVSELARRGVEPANIDVIRLGAFTYGTGESSAAPATVETEPILPALLFFGRITAYKGLEVLLQAFKQVSEKHSATLLIAGDGDLRPYRQWIEGDENIQVINRWIADVEVASVFQRANLVVLPYTSASQSGVIPIAASFRLPVIATRTGGIPEQIQDGLSGLLVEPGSVEKLSAAIERLLVDPEFRRSLGERLHDNFQNKHNWEQTAALVKAALEKAGAP